MNLKNYFQCLFQFLTLASPFSSRFYLVMVSHPSFCFVFGLVGMYFPGQRIPRAAGLTRRKDYMDEKLSNLTSTWGAIPRYLGDGGGRKMYIFIYGCWTKNRGKNPKMDGEDNGKPTKIHDLGAHPYSWKHPYIDTYGTFPPSRNVYLGISKQLRKLLGILLLLYINHIYIYIHIRIVFVQNCIDTCINLR